MKTDSKYVLSTVAIVLLMMLVSYLIQKGR